jgi:hypothetical protein
MDLLYSYLFCFDRGTWLMDIKSIIIWLYLRLRILYHLSVKGKYVEDSITYHVLYTYALIIYTPVVILCPNINATRDKNKYQRYTRIVKGKAVPLQAWSGPEGSRNLKFPDYMTTAHDGGKVISLTHRPPLPSGNAPGTHFCWRLSRPQDHSAIGRIMSMKNSNDIIWNRTSDLPICSTVP